VTFVSEFKPTEKLNFKGFSSWYMVIVIGEIMDIGHYFKLKSHNETYEASETLWDF
jgi:hypothetical protein